MVYYGIVLKEVVMINQIRMKQIIYAVMFSIFSSVAFGQVAIGKQEVEGNSTLLDFENLTTNGLILPAVNQFPEGLDRSTNGGTFLYDLADNKVKMYENGIWVDLSKSGNSSAILINTSTEVGAGAIIGSDKTEAKGVLVLESETKAMILPRIYSPSEHVKGPYPGMICYDTASKSIAVFDGEVWNFWK